MVRSHSSNTATNRKKKKKDLKFSIEFWEAHCVSEPRPGPITTPDTEEIFLYGVALLSNLSPPMTSSGRGSGLSECFCRSRFLEFCRTPVTDLHSSFGGRTRYGVVVERITPHYSGWEVRGVSSSTRPPERVRDPRLGTLPDKNMFRHCNTPVPRCY